MQHIRAASLFRLALTGLALWAPAASAAGTMMQAPAPAAIAPPEEQIAPGSAAPHALINAAIQFNSTERWLIPQYFQRVRERQRRAARYKSYPRALPAGMSSPPSVGDVLQPALLAKMESLPAPLVHELPAPRPDTRRYIAGQDVLLVQPSSGKVLDVLRGVLH